MTPFTTVERFADEKKRVSPSTSVSFVSTSNETPPSWSSLTVGASPMATGASLVGVMVRVVVCAGLVSVPDDRGLFPSLSVAEHFALVGSSVDAAAEVFPALEPLAGRRVGACSGGEQQQVALGLALVRQPQVLLVDELSMGLAPRVAAELLAGLRALADDRRTAVVVVEQFVDAVLGTADRGGVLGDGRVVRDEPAGALLADRSALEAAYLG